MKAMIFTGGLESSMHMQAADNPRALIGINGEPLLGMLIRRLAESGFNEIIINVHHFAARIRDYIYEKKFMGIRIEVSDETDLILDSGGGLKKVAWFFDDGLPFLVYNLEVLSDIDLGMLYRNHILSGALVTLVIRRRECERYMLFSESMELCGWENTETGESVMSKLHEGRLHPYAFSRIQVVNPSIFSLITERGAFPLAELYLRLASLNIIRGYPDNESIWMDLAKKEGMLEAEKLFLKN
jgi:NDP-sugar pyrophosphorylase family protein